MTEYRIDDLAREAGLSVRNVRAYQDKGLIPPPRRKGRIGWYSDEHLARLRVIGELLERRYTLANIAELVHAAEKGTPLADVLSLTDVVSSPYGDETPVMLRADELSEMFGTDLDSEIGAEALRVGFLEVVGDQIRVPSPRLLQAAAELHAVGVPLDALLAELLAVRADIDRVASRFVDLVAAHVVESFESGARSQDGAEELAAAISRIRPLGQIVVDSELNRAMERRAQERLHIWLEQFLSPPPPRVE